MANIGESSSRVVGLQTAFAETQVLEHEDEGSEDQEERGPA
jgi:hypothetical protein